MHALETRSETNAGGAAVPPAHVLPRCFPATLESSSGLDAVTGFDTRRSLRSAAARFGAEQKAAAAALQAGDATCLAQRRKSESP